MAKSLFFAMAFLGTFLNGASVDALSVGYQRSLDAYTGPVPSNVGRIQNSCPSSIIKTWDGSSFLCQNNTNFNAGDITGIIAYSLKDCSDACATMNKFTDGQCSGFTLDADVSRSYSINNGANCWLKRATSEGSYDYNGSSARLCEESDCSDLR